MTIVSMKSQISKNLEELLESTNTFIITDNLNYSKKKNLFLGIYYLTTCDLCKIPYIINTVNNFNIDFLISKMDKHEEINLILDSVNENNTSLNFISYLKSKKRCKINSYILNTTKGSSVILALSSTKIFLNDNGYLSPLRNIIQYKSDDFKHDIYDEKFGKFYSDYNDINFLVEKLFKTNDKIKKIKKYFINTDYINIYYDADDLKKIGLPVFINKNDEINKAYRIFTYLK